MIIIAQLILIISQHSFLMIVNHVILRLSGFPQLSIMTHSISLFTRVRITTGGPSVPNVISPLQTLQYLLVCLKDAIPSHLLIQIIMEFPGMYIQPAHAITVIQEVMVEEKRNCII